MSMTEHVKTKTARGMSIQHVKAHCSLEADGGGGARMLGSTYDERITEYLSRSRVANNGFA